MNLSEIIQYGYDLRGFGAYWLGPNLWWIKIVSVIFSGIFLWGIIYIIRRTNYLDIKHEQFLDIVGSSKVSKQRSIKAWKQIQNRLLSKEANQWKLAVLEADHILNEILKMSGYLEDKLEDKLELVTPAQLSNVEEIKRVHAIRDQISKDPTFEFSQEEAKQIVGVYEQSFKELNLIRE